MVPRSLSSRIYAVGLLAFVAVLGMVALLVTASERTSSAFIWVGHTEEMIRTVDELLGDLREAESGQRGFLLTHSPAYLDSFQERIASARARADDLVRLTEDNPAQHVRAQTLRRAVDARIGAVRMPLALAGRHDFAGAIRLVANGRGRALMEDVARRAEEIKSAEVRLLKIRSDEADMRAAWTRSLLVYGGPAVALLIMTGVYLLVRSIHGPLAQILAAMTTFGQGGFSARADTATGTREFDRLARAYNEMAHQLSQALDHQQRADQRLQKANADLRAQGEALQARGEAIERLGGMAHRMQAARTEGELADVLHCFLPQVLPHTPGVLYVYNDARSFLTRLSQWGDSDDLPETFVPHDCWALRRGQSHVQIAPGSDVVCAHVGDPGQIYRCEPVLAGGEVIGLLYLSGEIGAEQGSRLRILKENIALALVNHELQRSLREQSIRDPLTGLFNRRYMEEALDVERARSARSGEPFSLVMCDVDHFKKFNDMFGHEAGDTLLCAVAGLLQSHFRDGDIACRYGGEEFAIIAPSTTAANLARRTEELGAAIRAMVVHHAGRQLGQVTMSFGIGMADGHGEETLIRRADAALYDAKRLGRDRTVVAMDAEQPIAAE